MIVCDWSGVLPGNGYNDATAPLYDASVTLALACTCGWPIPGATVEEQLSALAAHIAAVHPGVTVEEIRADQQRAGWRVAPQLPTLPTRRPVLSAGSMQTGAPSTLTTANTVSWNPKHGFSIRKDRAPSDVIAPCAAA